jgi:hypothetical protein
MNKTHTDVEGIVEREVLDATNAILALIPNIDGFKHSTINHKVDAKIKTLLQSQADQYEKDLELLNRIHNESRGEVVKKITEHFDDFASAVDTDTDYCRGVKFGLRLAIQYLDEKRDGVDLS